MTDTDRYCYLDPPFPKKAWMVIGFIYIKADNSFSNMLPLFSLYTDLTPVKADILLLEKKTETAQIFRIPEEVCVTEVTLESLFPLKKEYWTNPQLQNTINRVEHLFRAAIVKHEMCKLLVTPKYFGEKSWDFFAYLPFIATSDYIRTLDYFMKTTDLEVSHEAKYAGIYTLSKPISYNYMTKEFSDFDISSMYSNAN